MFRSYLMTRVCYRKRRKAILSAGTDDGCKVWVNGEEVFRLPRLSLADRGRTPHPVHADLRIQGGMQGTSWGFRLNMRSTRLIGSCPKLFSEVLVESGNRQRTCVNMGLTRIVSPSV